MIEIHPNWHPILVHFTIALFSTAGGLIFLSKFKVFKKIQLWLFHAGLANLWIGALITVVTIWTGPDAYLYQKEEVT
jgi:uncharacterized membrane protein